MIEGFAGVDVAFAKGKHLPVSLCRWECGRLIPYPLKTLPIAPPRGSGNVAILDASAVREFARSAARYLRDAASELGIQIIRIGIDAPSSPCREGSQRRSAEQALDRARVSCFATPSRTGLERMRKKVASHLEAGGAVNRLPHANQLWMLVGFALFEELSEIAECIEVFPQATAHALGAAGIHKFRAGGVDAQLRAVARQTGWPSEWKGDTDLSSIAWGPRHDCLDAYLSAWVAALDEADRVAFGTPPDEVIWVPKLGDLPERSSTLEQRAARRSEAARNANATRKARREAAARTGAIPQERAPAQMCDQTEHARSCPACGDKQFKRWPWGWDGHAAHACTGLEGSDPEERKREFRRRFADLF